MKKFRFSTAGKKLFMAALGLAIAVMSTIGSTFAWFSMNNVVTATGMNIKVQSESTLLIDVDSTLTNGRLAHGAATQATTDSATKALKPTSTVNGSNWFKAEASAPDASTAKAASYSEVASGDYVNYLASYTFYLQVYDNSQTGAMDPAKDIKVQDITVTANKSTTDISNCLRVLVVQNTSKVFTAPVDTTDNQGVASVSAGAATKSAISWAAYTKDGNVATLSSNNTLVSGVVYNTVYTVTVYVYFDGEDADCYSDNIPTAEQLADYNIAISFALADQA